MLFVRLDIQGLVFGVVGNGRGQHVFCGMRVDVCGLAVFPPTGQAKYHRAKDSVRNAKDPAVTW